MFVVNIFEGALSEGKKGCGKTSIAIVGSELVNSGQLTATTECLTYARCRINQRRCNRFALYFHMCN
jgi:hypothetical protein